MTTGKWEPSWQSALDWMGWRTAFSNACCVWQHSGLSTPSWWLLYLLEIFQWVHHSSTFPTLLGRSMYRVHPWHDFTCCVFLVYLYFCLEALVMFFSLFVLQCSDCTCRFVYVHAFSLHICFIIHRWRSRTRMRHQSVLYLVILTWARLMESKSSSVSFTPDSDLPFDISLIQVILLQAYWSATREHCLKGFKLNLGIFKCFFHEDHVWCFDMCRAKLKDKMGVYCQSDGTQNCQLVLSAEF